jgi:acetyltransferase-like isoleucine patch superfamily enzyme
MNNIIHDSFKHGENFKIGHFCVIEEDVIVGENVKIDNYVMLKKGTRILNNVWIDSYVRSSGDNLIGNNTTLRFGCTIAREVVVKDGAFISPNVMTIYSTHKHEKSGGTVIGKNSFIGTAAVLGPSVKIGEKVVIASQAFVSRDCLEQGTYIGIPAKLKE